MASEFSIDSDEGTISVDQVQLFKRLEKAAANADMTVEEAISLLEREGKNLEIQRLVGITRSAIETNGQIAPQVPANSPEKLQELEAKRVKLIALIREKGYSVEDLMAKKRAGLGKGMPYSSGQNTEADIDARYFLTTADLMAMIQASMIRTKRPCDAAHVDFTARGGVVFSDSGRHSMVLVNEANEVDLRLNLSFQGSIMYLKPEQAKAWAGWLKDLVVSSPRIHLNYRAHPLPMSDIALDHGAIEELPGVVLANPPSELPHREAYVKTIDGVILRVSVQDDLQGPLYVQQM